MMSMIQNKTLAEKYPMIAEMQNKSSGNEDRFLQMLQGCGFEKLLALMSIASSNAGGFGNQEETEISE